DCLSPGLGLRTEPTGQRGRGHPHCHPCDGGQPRRAFLGAVERRSLMVRAFRSELLKFRRWSVLAGSGVMIAATAFIAYLTFHQITSGTTGPELTPLIQAFPTPQGLITVVGQARSLIIVIALIMVTSNIAADGSQGTSRNLLVPELGPLRL